jgi:hypothetical protein
VTFLEVTSYECHLQQVAFSYWSTGHSEGFCFSLVNYATSWKVAGSMPNEVIGFFIGLTLPAALWPWGLLSLKQKWVPGIFLGFNGGWHVRLSRLSAKCGNLNISQPYGPPWSVTEVVLLFLLSAFSPPHKDDQLLHGLIEVVYKIKTKMWFATDGKWCTVYSVWRSLT